MDADHLLKYNQVQMINWEVIWNILIHTSTACTTSLCPQIVQINQMGMFCLMMA
jgi:hypothetical protein